MSSNHDKLRLHIVVLAAGKGTRMDSDLAKVLHLAAARPLLSWVLDATADLDAVSTTVVVGHQADAVRAILPDGVASVLQSPQNGTGHAARLAVEAVSPDDDDVIVVLPGDMPLLSPGTLVAMIREHDAATSAVLVSTIAEDPNGYGRIVRDESDRVVGIVEELDATHAQREIHEVNTSVYSFTAAPMRRALGDVGRDNVQGEQYLTDVIGWLAGRGAHVKAVIAPSAEGMGVNTQAQLEAVDAVLRAREASSSQDGSSSLR
jgi:bifunctional UDP-N-acetylglucosamine pyrophosphorylase/glucosamine-1-phosphate N-acetyltransferase